MFFNNAFARPGMFASQRNNFQVPNAQPQPAPPPQQLPSGYQSQSYQTFSVQPGAENTVMGRTLSPAEREATMTNDMGMPPRYNAPSPSIGIGDLMRRQAAMQAIAAPQRTYTPEDFGQVVPGAPGFIAGARQHIYGGLPKAALQQSPAAPPMASNTMGMEQPLFYRAPQMMGIMSLLSNLFGDNFGQPPAPVRLENGEPPRPDFNMVDNDMGMSNFRDRPKASPPSAPVSPPARVTDMFGSPQGLGGFARPQMGFGGKGGIKGGGMYGRPSYGMQARYSSPFQGFF